jgi:di/tricarboxylate transporter
MFIVLIKEWLLPEITVFLALTAVILFGILTPKEALIGFANPGVHTVALLLIIGAAISKTGILSDIVEKILGSNTSIKYVILRLMLPVSALSAFINNTPIVTMLIPTIQNWAISNQIKPSKLLIPLSYATILGGTITLIGTSTNLIVQGFLIERGLEGFHLFDFTIIGLPLTIGGILYMFMIGHYLLPSRNHNTEVFVAEQHHFLFEFVVEQNSPLIGQTIQAAKLRELHHLFLIQMKRKGRLIVPTPNDEVLQGEDLLLFSGSPQGLQQISRLPGLKLRIEGGKHPNTSSLETLFEVVISSRSPLLDKKIKESNFRSKYNAAIVAVKRKSKQITSGIGEVVIKQGDTLILLAKHDFVKNWTDSDDFYLISPIKIAKKSNFYPKLMITGILLGIIVSSVFQLLTIFQLCLLATAIILLTKLLSIADAKKAINWDVIILMACSIGIGEAIEKTGLAQLTASILTKLQPSFGLLGVVVAYYVFTMVMTEVLNNLATASLMFPIGYSISQQLHLDPMMFAMITAIAASCSFLTPIGYQTNLLVYGPGGYKFTDYLKVGFPLSLICMTITVFIAYLKWL